MQKRNNVCACGPDKSDGIRTGLRHLLAKWPSTEDEPWLIMDIDNPRETYLVHF